MVAYRLSADMGAHMEQQTTAGERRMGIASVLTVRKAADRLGVHKDGIAKRLLRKELTPAKINGRPAVLEDSRFRRVERERGKERAA